ncbi:MAG: aminoglycoside 6-adenylyltransferase [Alphaproteobacteria bacterium]
MSATAAAMQPAVDAFYNRFIAWAMAAPDVRAVIQIGEFDRKATNSPAWSDVDLLIATTQPQRRLAETDWLARLGQPVMTFIESAGLADESQRRVVFDDGIDLDLVPVTTSRLRHWVDMGVAEDQSATGGRGYRVLVDKEDFAPRLAEREGVGDASGRAELPDRVQFGESVRDFWYQAGRCAKLVGRGDLWTARACCDVYMKRLLLRVLAWQTKVRHGDDTETWYEGRNLERWADDDQIDALGETFARYDKDDIVRALFATMALFSAAAHEAAGGLGYRYLEEAESAATATIQRAL